MEKRMMIGIGVGVSVFIILIVVVVVVAVIVCRRNRRNREALRRRHTVRPQQTVTTQEIRSVECRVNYRQSQDILKESAGDRNSDALKDLKFCPGPSGAVAVGPQPPPRPVA